MLPPSLLDISLGMGLIDLPMRATFSPAHIPSEGSPRPRVARAKRVEGTPATFHRVRLETPIRPLSANLIRHCRLNSSRDIVTMFVNDVEIRCEDYVIDKLFRVGF